MACECASGLRAQVKVPRLLDQCQIQILQVQQWRLGQDDAQVDFTASVSDSPSMLDRLCDRAKEPTASTPLHGVAFVSSPGYGVLDSGCGRTIIGADALDASQKIWKQLGMPTPEFVNETHQFKFANGGVETSSKVVLMPVTLAGRKGIIRASIVGSEAPLLISRSAFKKNWVPLRVLVVTR